MVQTQFEKYQRQLEKNFPKKINSENINKINLHKLKTPYDIAIANLFRRLVSFKGNNIRMNKIRPVRMEAPSKLPQAPNFAYVGRGMQKISPSENLIILYIMLKDERMDQQADGND